MELTIRGNPSVYSLMLVATSPFRGDIVVFRDFNFGYYYELLYAPGKGAGKITLVILTEGCVCIAINITRRNEKFSPEELDLL